MQFVANGPDIPDTLLRAHEDGRVVFFCGAGISYPAGLPGFDGLVKNVYKIVGSSPNLVESESLGRAQYDATLDLLERRLPGHRSAVRKAVAQALQPNLRKKGAVETHKALLHLARNRDGTLRLVTTNFDRVFAKITASMKPSVPAFAAPFLPIPKNSRWDGLVYLHGLLPANPGDLAALNRLVFTSGDFGLAYLTERWASRFVAELFRNYIVCFVGYSINDPVLRYMMDAIAADRMLGEAAPQAYALGDCSPGSENSKEIEWAAKGVTPILYQVPSGSHDHSALHKTLKAWSETHRDGILGKERIVVQYAAARPSLSTQQDDFVGRMLWAISDSSGLAAKAFADLDPVPPLDWLDAFSGNRFRHCDLERFGVSPDREIDDKLEFSLLYRPAPYKYSGWMRVVSNGARECDWDPVMRHVARWLLRHLDDPNLIFWAIEQGGVFQQNLLSLIEGEMNLFNRLHSENKLEELARIKLRSPGAVPRRSMATVWRLFFNGRIKSSRLDMGFYQWKNRLLRDGLTPTLRFELRELLAPKIELSRPFWPKLFEEDAGAPEGLEQLVNCKLVLSDRHIRSGLEGFEKLPLWLDALPELLEDFLRLLRDAMDLLREVGQAHDLTDLSRWDIPSIDAHPQNEHSRSWIVLVELIRDSWLALRAKDRGYADLISHRWFTVPYPVFKRLALFGASKGACSSDDQWIDWLLVDRAWWLWSPETKGEVLRLLVSRGNQLQQSSRERLESAILVGPPREMFRDDLEADGWRELREEAIMLRLSRLETPTSALGIEASEELRRLLSEHPNRVIQKNERDEFSIWMDESDDPRLMGRASAEAAPRKRAQLTEWLRGSSQDPFEHRSDTWIEVCRSRFFHCSFALRDLANEGIWPPERWSEALQVWSEGKLVGLSWRFLAPVVVNMPSEVLLDISHPLAWWVAAASKSAQGHELIFWNVCKRLIGLPYEGGMDLNDVVTQAINHPIGRVAEAVFHQWFRRNVNDGEGIPDDIRAIFEELLDLDVPMFRHGRVILASRLIALFRVDRAWAGNYVLPLFDWNLKPLEAQAAWEGFLWSPRLYPPLLKAIKPIFLDTANHYQELRDHGSQFAIFLTFAALEPVESYSHDDFRGAFAALPESALLESASALVRALDSAGEKREVYWENRVLLFWKQVWPQFGHLKSKALAEILARVSISAGGQFPQALDAVYDWLQPIGNLFVVVHLLAKSDLVERFPVDVLKLLSAIIEDRQTWGVGELRVMLEGISERHPRVRSSKDFVKIVEYCRKYADG